MYVYQRQQYPVKMMLQAVICRLNFRQITILATSTTKDELLKDQV